VINLDTRGQSLYLADLVKILGTPASYPGGTEFESRAGHCLFLSPYGKIPKYYLD
jgi:hypothetical protein